MARDALRVLLVRSLLTLILASREPKRGARKQRLSLPPSSRSSPIPLHRFDTHCYSLAAINEEAIRHHEFRRSLGWGAFDGRLLDLRCVGTRPRADRPGMVRLDVTDGDDLRFVRLSRSQGLSQQRVTDIVQDQRGFLWFATQYGLNRYDGYRFRVFKNDPADVGSVCDVHITALFSDREGRIWVGCAYSVDRYDPVTEKFVHYRLDPPNAAANQWRCQAHQPGS